ncbi:unnamed protein product [Caenorhabditis sp. 36 PRJEB53466]|nr:unnamed protein product [Caenorhabditis sp. 36 PRJEB53466]
MSTEENVRQIVANELSVSRAVCQETLKKMQIHYELVMKLSLSPAEINWVKNEFADHTAMAEICLEEEDIQELKRATTCMSLYTTKLHQLAKPN